MIMSGSSRFATKIRDMWALGPRYGTGFVTPWCCFDNVQIMITSRAGVSGIGLPSLNGAYVMFWSSPETSLDALEIGHRERHARWAVGNLVRTGEMGLYGGAVPGDLLDLFLIALAAAFAVAGYRQGFIVGVLSFVGFLGGAAVGAAFSPAIARALVSGPARQALVAIIVVFIAAMIGQLVASLAGAAVRSRV